MAPQIAVGRALDLDHVGAEVRQNRRGRRTRDIGSTIDNLKSGKDSLTSSHKTLKLRIYCQL